MTDPAPQGAIHSIRVPDNALTTNARPRVRGKFVFVGEEKLYIRGVTYGPFRPNGDGCEYHGPKIVERDFALMVANGVNAVRTYTVPPRWLLDLARKCGLRVMVGLPWEQHVAFLDGRERRRSIEERVRSGVRACANHPAVLCFAIGNEIPAHIVRWYGRRRVERFLRLLTRAVRAEDPGALVTYVNYPTTEYLQLPFIDIVCFNVYLETRDRLDAYLARLQNLAGDRPLVMAEVGLDSRRNGTDGQAEILDWQVRTAFAAGCAGTFVFAWTDEWHRGGFDVEDWSFGITDRSRRPKPALSVVHTAFSESPFRTDQTWPRVSVVVCTHNGSPTIRDCCEGLLNLAYPDYEVIVVDDGSADGTAAIVGEYGFKVTRTGNRGLSNARNTGLAAASGEIVAYIDDDAYPDPHWLTYLARTFIDTAHVAVGGPNIAPPGDGTVAECVASSPGGPTQVLLSDREAEHIPGCNMAFRRDALQAIGGFDPQFRIAGDDVDVCWRLRQRGWSLGFSPAAVVWHHHRNSVTAYWKQQVNYGKAEALLERKWPEKYNSFGHLRWKGRLYGNGSAHATLFRRWRIYHGPWGSGPFQSVYETAPGTLLSLLLMPEWYLVIAGLTALSLLGVVWWPLRLAWPLLLLAAAAPLSQAVACALRAEFPATSRLARLKSYALTALLHVLQPLARSRGRFHQGLTPWRRRRMPFFAFPRPRAAAIWSEHGRPPREWLEAIEAVLDRQGAVTRRGGAFDRWDLEIRDGAFGAVRMRMAIEEHGSGKQLVRFRAWPRPAALAPIFTLLFALLAGVAGLGQAWSALIVFGVAAVFLATRTFSDCAGVMGACLHAIEHLPMGED